MNFEWDSAKAESNLKKHGVGFPEATTVFSDFLSISIPDPDHSERECRFLIFGRSAAGNYIVASFTDRNDRIRIINARKMTRAERKAYES